MDSTLMHFQTLTQKQVDDAREKFEYYDKVSFCHTLNHMTVNCNRLDGKTRVTCGLFLYWD